MNLAWGYFGLSIQGDRIKKFLGILATTPSASQPPLRGRGIYQGNFCPNSPPTEGYAVRRGVVLIVFYNKKNNFYSKIHF